ncbi:MAG TPA: ABC transporter ATP-binding protein [Baekduia sp.]|nr:ABC transporter ATP-binding protein [Baekduia sp.]
MTSVQLERVRRSYGDLLVVDDVSIEVAPGEVIAIVGPSGCGKSTLLDLICKLQAPDSGSVTAERAVLMPQRDLLLPWMNALQNAALPLKLRGEDESSAHAMMGELGLDGFEHAHVWELSGGMRQRVAFARTLLSGAPVLCLDEPFGALDAITRAGLHEWLAGALASTPRTVVFVTHDVEEAVLLADHVVVLSPRPARVIETIAVPLARPRRGTDADVVALRARVLAAMA